MRHYGPEWEAWSSEVSMDCIEGERALQMSEELQCSTNHDSRLLGRHVFPVESAQPLALRTQDESREYPFALGTWADNHP